MAIKDFKNIVDRKGYLVDSEDRKVFEKEISKSNFGLGCADVIEFILYDTNNNQLPQGDTGKLVRYIYLDDEKSKEYFLTLPTNSFTKNTKDSQEFVVDLEKLIQDAGYSNGSFKTQITLLNRRIGTEEVESNKMWIHEISASRTEVRILPIRRDSLNEDLEKRYSIFTNESSFRDDVIYTIQAYVDSCSVEKIKQFILLSKGKETDGKKYVDLIKKEFKISNFDEFVLKVKDKWIESLKYFVQGLNWNISSTTYGKPSAEKLDCVELSVDEIKRIAETALINSLEYYLPKRDIQKDNILSKEEQITIDALKNILKTSTSNSIYSSTEPDSVDAEVGGCTDPSAENFNPAANKEDGSCVYKEEETVILGCTDSSAKNYNSLATENDGSCTYEEIIQSVTKIYYVWSSTATMKWKLNGLAAGQQSGVEYDSFTITHDVGQFKVAAGDDVREVAKTREEVISPSLVEYSITNISNANSIVKQPNQYGGQGSPENSMIGYVDVYSDFEIASLDGGTGQVLTSTYKNELGQVAHFPALLPGDSIIVCAQEGSVTQISGLKITRRGECGAAPQPNPTNSNTNTNTSGGGGGRNIPTPGQEEVIDSDVRTDQQYQ
jgi:hypothetical protein